MNDTRTAEPATGRGSPPERRGVSRTKPIDAAKELVPIEDFAERLSGEGKRVGREIAFRCPLHDDHNPSMLVDPGKGLWHCFPCGEGGDVVRLAQLVWRHEDAASAAVDLLLSFGCEPPQRPPSWYAKQRRQKPVRDELDRLRVEILRRRLFRILEPMVRAVEDDELREEVARDVWSALWPQAEQMLSERQEEGAS